MIFLIVTSMKIRQSHHTSWHTRDWILRSADKFFTLPGHLGIGGRRYVLRLSVQERKIRATVIPIIRCISLLSHRLNCIAVGSGQDGVFW